MPYLFHFLICNQPYMILILPFPLLITDSRDLLEIIVLYRNCHFSGLIQFLECRFMLVLITTQNGSDVVELGVSLVE